MFESVICGVSGRKGLPFLRGDEVQLFRLAENDYSKDFHQATQGPHKTSSAQKCATSKPVGVEEPSLAACRQGASAHAYKRFAFETVACWLIVKRFIVSHFKMTNRCA
ncbi:MAG: hypothetical protein ACI87E_003994 [Mariniblastus sp.]